jgi:hypothetical protein
MILLGLRSYQSLNCVKYFLKNNSIYYKKEYHEEERAYNELTKFEIIFGTYTIIKPFTMMIKILNTSITFCTMK